MSTHSTSVATGDTTHAFTEEQFREAKDVADDTPFELSIRTREETEDAMLQFTRISESGAPIHVKVIPRFTAGREAMIGYTVYKQIDGTSLDSAEDLGKNCSFKDALFITETELTHTHHTNE